MPRIKYEIYFKKIKKVTHSPSFYSQSYLKIDDIK